MDDIDRIICDIERLRDRIHQRRLAAYAPGEHPSRDQSPAKPKTGRPE